MPRGTRVSVAALIERWLPFLLATVITIVVFMQGSYPGWIKNFKDILAGVINVAAILIGFLTTMLSLLIAITNKNVIKRIKKNNGIGLMTSYFIVPIALGFLMIAASLLLLPYAECTNQFSKLLLVSWAFLVSYFVTTSLRIIVVLQRIFVKVSEETSMPIEAQKTYRPDVSKAFENANKSNAK